MRRAGGVSTLDKLGDSGSSATLAMGGVGGGRCGNLDARPGVVLGWVLISVDGWVAIDGSVVLCCVALRWFVMQ
jgi:hypothetical protein